MNRTLIGSGGGRAFRPGVLVAVCVAVIVGAALTHAIPQEEYALWVTLGDSNQLVEMNPYTFEEVRRIETDPKLHGLAITQDGSTIYLASDRTGNFQVVDAREGRIVDQINIGTDPNQMTLTKDERFAYVPMRGEDTVAVVELNPLRLLKKIPASDGPHDSYTSADGSRVIVGGQFGGGIDVIDTTTQSRLYTIPTDDGVRPMQITRDGKTVYAALSNLIGFVVVDIEGRVTRRVELAKKTEGLPEPYLETYTHALQLSPDETELWVTDCIHDLVRIVRLSDMQEVATIPVGHFPHWFTMFPDGSRTFVSLWSQDAVAAIDTASRQVIANMQVGRETGPKRIAVARKVR
jgi:YVTN family beta-propeller protein